MTMRGVLRMSRRVTTISSRHFTKKGAELEPEDKAFMAAFEQSEVYKGIERYVRIKVGIFERPVF